VGLTLAPLSDFDLGAVAAALVGFAAWRAGALSAGGAVAAATVGTATFGALGVPGAAVLFAFFLTSVGLSRYRRERKRTLLADVGKTGARDAAQVLANGGIAAACALLALWVDHRFAAAFAGAFAAATADTWGTELGSLAAGSPRSIVNGRQVNVGLSGGITLPGTLAEVAGALFVALVACAGGFHSFVAIAAGGVAGAFADSLLGATAQTLRYCPQCQRETEREPHSCGANTRIVRGLPWMNNDLVNAVATLAGAAAAFVLA
jgi:uncharacterized protein (TIGR00297 family)